MIAELLSGGLVGLFGSMVTNVTDYMKARQKNSHDLELRKLDILALEKEAAFRLSESADKLMSDSYANESIVSQALATRLAPSKLSSFIFVLLECVRALVRPVLTLYLIYQVYLLQSNINDVLMRANIASLDITVAIDMYSEIVRMILFLSSTSIAWWFGTRVKAN